ncbi:MAG: sigma-70 family RNA polymerase sigma factor [Chloroflexota bacterium]|nr:sigma-70 family RNA polymerase sigma factor [Chloroflexota bacterium]
MEDLSARLAANVDEAFTDLVTGHADLVFGVALRALNDRMAAEDAAQEAFVRAYRALQRYSTERILALRLRPWLARIALNVALNHRRSEGPAGAGLDAARSHEHPGDGPLRLAERSEEHRFWARLLGQLPERYRLAVGLRHVECLTYPELAQALGRPLGSVKSDVHRGVALLRAAYAAELRLIERKEAV